ncbi:hypothetical protein Tco_0957366 [Tanacetum coccineum]
MKIQAGVQVSRQGELRRHLQLWKCFGRLYFIVIVLDRNIICFNPFICVWMLDVDVANPLGVVFGDIIIGSVECCNTARLQLGKVAESHRFPDKMKVAFDQARKEEASFAALMHELCCSLRVSLCKKRRLAAELEGLGEQGDAVKALENMKDIVTCDLVTLGDLEQLLARAQVGVDLKDGYVADLEEKV